MSCQCPRAIKAHRPSDLAMSTITLAEICHGIEKSPVKTNERRNKIERIYSMLEVYPFDEPAALKYAIIRTQLEKDVQVISERDLQIASIAMAKKLIVVTHNEKEFTRVSKLEIEDWAVESGR